MICPRCGRQHENAKGRCPFCLQRTSLSKKQKERPAESAGRTSFECTECGDEVRFVSLKKVGKVIDDVPVHVSTGKFGCPTSK